MKRYAVCLAAVLVCQPLSAAELLSNGSFDTGSLVPWTLSAGGSIGVVMSSSGMTALPPLSSMYMVSSSLLDGGGPPVTPIITIEQSVDVSAHSSIPDGSGMITASCWAHNIANGPLPSPVSDDVVHIELEYFDGSMTSLGTVATTPIDPTPASSPPLAEWMEMSIGPVTAPVTTETIVFRYVTTLATASSIDIAGDDCSLDLDPLPVELQSFDIE